MVSGSIRKNQIQTSSDYSPLNNFDSARISLVLQQGTGWIPSLNDSQPWLEVTFDTVYRIAAVITQGCGNEYAWVTSYSFSYLHGGLNQSIDYISGTEHQVIESIFTG